MPIDINSPIAKWRRDLVKDIRVFDQRDDWDWNGGGFISVPDRHIEVKHPTEGYAITMSPCNMHALNDHFLRVRDNCKAILEIGVNHNSTPTPMTSTNMLLSSKLQETVYIGVDINDKSYLNNKEQNVFTIKEDSSNLEKIIEYAASIGVDSFDFIFIDGWHSINQVLKEWEYTAWLSRKGIVGIHDTAVHPGPSLLVKNIDRSKWEVLENSCGFSEHDFGIGFVWQK